MQKLEIVTPILILFTLTVQFEAHNLDKIEVIKHFASLTFAFKF
jgi:hypothetical protein